MCVWKNEDDAYARSKLVWHDTHSLRGTIMQLRAWALSFGFLLAFIPDCRAANSTIFAEGLESCSAFVKAADSERSAIQSPGGKDDPTYIIFAAYASGFLSGMNSVEVTYGKRADVGATSDVHARMLSIEDWCRANPTKVYAQAVVKLYMDLRDHSK